MSVNKHQFQLPLTVTKCHPRSGAKSDRERHKRPVPSASCARNEGPVTIRHPRAAAPESEEARMPTPTFVALTDLANLRAAGIAYPSTVHGWRWLFRNRHERGLDDAFRRIGRRIVVDPERYRELVRARSG